MQTLIRPATGLTLVFLLFLFVLKADSQPADAQYPIIPYPSHLTPAPGHFIITPATTIVLPDGPVFRNEANALNTLLANSFGQPLAISYSQSLATGMPAGKKAILFTSDSSIEAAEGYRLTITPMGMTVVARTAAGMFMAVQTIRQLLPARAERSGHDRLPKITLPAVDIEDAPAWSWRGMHLDVSRHFFSIGYLKKFINVMALYKMNKLHLHLTDDQGWRIEIKKYPLLTEQGAWRTFDRNDSACIRKSHDNPDFVIDPQHIRHKDGKTLYGGFYTQEEMKGLVAYAAARHIDIIPEIDMPGHMMAAITAYPYLSCNGENSFGELFSKPICPCNETTFEFAENVFTEIMDIFPSTYIHIGGDEVDRSDWAKSTACKSLMEREGIKDLPALQSYFINRMEKFFRSKGRRMIGWDEVIEGGINPTAIVMYWRSWVPDAPVKAALNGNSVIMAPGDPLYFDNPPDKNSLSRVYHFNPIPVRLMGEERKAIIGAQAQLWSENIPSERRADYMFMPRMTALAELLWTNKSEDYPSYLDRLQRQYGRLDELQVHYRLPDLPDMITENVFVNADTLTVKKPLADMRIFYTTDGSLPSLSATELKAPLIIKRSATIKLAAFTPNGIRGDIYALHYKQQDYTEAIGTIDTHPGLVCHYYKAYFKQTSLIAPAKSDSSFISNTITVPPTVTAPSFAINYKGYIDIPADGIYSFFLTCDDGGVLKIADRVVVDNDGLHSAIEKNGQIALRKGLQPFNLDFIEGGGGYTLKLQYSVNGLEPADIPAGWFKN
jgi:hexosaminidase